MILLIDNYDSFSYNLYQLVGSLNPEVRVLRNDALTVPEIAALRPSHILLSPGPGKPADAGVCPALVRELGGQVPILGVCLGHQAIFEAFGGRVGHAKTLMHGKQSAALLDGGCRLFRGLPPRIQVARYHSLAALPETQPPELRVTARTEDGEILALDHNTLPIYGLQFHPESILTEGGKTMMKNFLEVRHD